MNLTINLKKIKNKIQSSFKIYVTNNDSKKKIIKTLGLIDYSQNKNKVFIKNNEINYWLLNSKIKNKKILSLFIKLKSYYD